MNRNITIEETPQIGNPEHIEYIKRWQRITAGEESFAEVTWYFGNYSKVKDWADIRYDLNYCNTIFFVMYCPVCRYRNRYLFPYRPEPLHYESLIAASNNIEKGFRCKHCKQPFIADIDGSIYFKTHACQE